MAMAESDTVDVRENSRKIDKEKTSDGLNSCLTHFV